jgi:hypothetical protein
MAKINFERSGGFLEPPIELMLDLDAFAPHEARHLMYLIEDADFFHLPKNLVTEPSVDEFLYTITVETDSLQHRIYINEMNLTEPLQLLIDELSSLLVPVS